MKIVPNILKYKISLETQDNGTQRLIIWNNVEGRRTATIFQYNKQNETQTR